MPKTQIMFYGNVVGISGGDTFVNKPDEPGQLGCVVDQDHLEISRDALEFLKRLHRCSDSIGDVMCFQSIPQGRVIFGWMGPKNQIISADRVGDRDFKPELLEPFVVPFIEPPAALKEFIDRRKDAKTLIFFHKDVVGLALGSQFEVGRVDDETQYTVDFAEIQISQEAFDFLTKPGVLEVGDQPTLIGRQSPEAKGGGYLVWMERPALAISPGMDTCNLGFPWDLLRERIMPTPPLQGFVEFVDRQTTTEAP